MTILQIEMLARFARLCVRDIDLVVNGSSCLLQLQQG